MSCPQKTQRGCVARCTHGPLLRDCTVAGSRPFGMPGGLAPFAQAFAWGRIVFWLWDRLPALGVQTYQLSLVLPTGRNALCCRSSSALSCRLFISATACTLQPHLQGLQFTALTRSQEIPGRNYSRGIRWCVTSGEYLRHHGPSGPACASAASAELPRSWSALERSHGMRTGQPGSF